MDRSTCVQRPKAELRKTLCLLATPSLLLSLSMAPALAETSHQLTIRPSVPTPIDDLRVEARSACPGAWEEATIEGNTITLVNYEPVPPLGAPCSTDLPFAAEFRIGNLTAGEYQVDLFFRDSDDSLSLVMSENFSVYGELTYDLGSGAVIEGCGGFAGSCDFFGLEGSITIDVDLDPSQASITSSSLLIGSIGSPSFPFPAVDDLALTDLTGTIDNGELYFVDDRTLPQSARLELSVSSAGLILNGFYDEGCCDRFRFELENVLLSRPSAPSEGFTLRNGRFEVSASWTDFDGGTGPATGVRLTDESAWFWFFSETNAELLVKVLDGCDLFSHFWFFAAGLTNVGVEIRVEDTTTGKTRTYSSAVGTDFQPILDTTAFETCDG